MKKATQPLHNIFGYVDNDPLVAIDPTGLVKRTGSFRALNASVGKKIGRVPLKVGRNEITIDLESPSVNGKKVVVSLRSVNPDDAKWINSPMELYRSGSVEVEDNFSSPNPQALEGAFSMKLSAFGVGFKGKISVGAASGTFSSVYGLVAGEHAFTGTVKMLFGYPKEVSCECE